MKPKRQNARSVSITQGSLNFAKRGGSISKEMYSPFLAQVTERYSDRMTCDVITTDGQPLLNIPVMTVAGLVDEKPYGILDLPEIDDWVVVGRAGQGERKKVIIGTFVPYLTNEFKDDAVNSDNKAFSLKLLEEGKEMHYRRIFKSGTTLEVEEDGTITIEVPTGTYIKLDEANEEIHVEDAHGNIITMDSDGMILNDTNGNDVTMESGKVSINGNLEVDQ